MIARSEPVRVEESPVSTPTLTAAPTRTTTATKAHRTATAARTPTPVGPRCPPAPRRRRDATPTATANRRRRDDHDRRADARNRVDDHSGRDVDARDDRCRRCAQVSRRDRRRWIDAAASRGERSGRASHPRRQARARASSAEPSRRPPPPSSRRAKARGHDRKGVRWQRQDLRHGDRVPLADVGCMPGLPERRRRGLLGRRRLLRRRGMRRLCRRLGGRRTIARLARSFRPIPRPRPTRPSTSVRRASDAPQRRCSSPLRAGEWNGRVCQDVLGAHRGVQSVRGSGSRLRRGRRHCPRRDRLRCGPDVATDDTVVWRTDYDRSRTLRAASRACRKRRPIRARCRTVDAPHAWPCWSPRRPRRGRVRDIHEAVRRPVSRRTSVDCGSMTGSRRRAAKWLSR